MDSESLTTQPHHAELGDATFGMDSVAKLDADLIVHGLAVEELAEMDILGKQFLLDLIIEINIALEVNMEPDDSSNTSADENNICDINNKQEANIDSSTEPTYESADDQIITEVNATLQIYPLSVEGISEGYTDEDHIADINAKCAREFSVFSEECSEESSEDSV
jgi:hypothetical protein